MSSFSFERFSAHLSRFDFNALFTDVLGWNHPPASERKWRGDEHKGMAYQHRMVAELSGVAVLEIVCENGWPDETERMALWRHLSLAHYENLLIFLDKITAPSQSLWYWVKRVKDADTGKQKLIARRHEYFRGQPTDLFASKLKSMVVELAELDERGRISVMDVVRRMETALDVEKTTKRFYAGYQEQHEQLLLQIEGIDNERDRRWYASVILNRLMFVWFLQKKLFLDGGSEHYLTHKLQESRLRGPDRFYCEFLNALFFDAFAKPETDRSPEVKVLTGTIPYLNGGLFLHHKLEEDETGQPRVGITLHIPDVAFDGIFKLFSDYSWHLDDTPAGNADELNPDVLGYIFEKYINQKAFGAYYTRPEITGYLAERSIHRLILERVSEEAVPALGWPAVAFPTVADMLARMDTRVALRLVNEVLPSLTILDPAVGSGAFLVAALKVLINIYYAIVGRAELGASKELDSWLKSIRKDHPSVGYYIKRKIVTDNLYGVDIMEEAGEIAKLRLFLAMVSSVRSIDELEPLPNIDFNILAGNSLIGLVHVDPAKFDAITATPSNGYSNKKQDRGMVAEAPALDFGSFSATERKDLTKEYRNQRTAEKFSRLLEEKNRLIDLYRHTAGYAKDLRSMRDTIEENKREAIATLNKILLEEFNALGIKFEEATWDTAKNKEGKPNKRALTLKDIDALQPFHWGYEFDEILNKRGGFDAVITNPPWDVLEPSAKEFFEEHSEVVTKNKMSLQDFEKERTKILSNETVKKAWLEYLSSYHHVSRYFKLAPQYVNQISIIAGRTAASKTNLYKLFVEQVFSLLKNGGECGMVIPDGIYNSRGATQLRRLLLEQTAITGLFCLENRKDIFEGVDSRFKIAVLTFEKGKPTSEFPAAFMRTDVAELDHFPSEGAITLSAKLICEFSPEMLAVTEFKGERDVQIVRKFLAHPRLDETIPEAWNVFLAQELNMTSDNGIFEKESRTERLPLVQGGMIHQFNADFSEPKFWIDAEKGRKAILGRTPDKGQILTYQSYRFAHRRIARSTDERAAIACVLPPNRFCADTAQTTREIISPKPLMVLTALFNSFIVDWELRLRITTHIDMHFVYAMRIPRLTEKDPAFRPIVERAARLICTTPEFDDLAKEAGIGSHKQGVTNEVDRGRLRAELDGLIAHLYGLTEEEFAYILTTFPLVADPVKIAAQNAFRDVERGLIK